MTGLAWIAAIAHLITTAYVIMGGSVIAIACWGIWRSLHAPARLIPWARARLASLSDVDRLVEQAEALKHDVLLGCAASQDKVEQAVLRIEAALDRTADWTAKELESEAASLKDQREQRNAWEDKVRLNIAYTVTIKAMAGFASRVNCLFTVRCYTVQGDSGNVTVLLTRPAIQGLPGTKKVSFHQSTSPWGAVFHDASVIGRKVIMFHSGDLQAEDALLLPEGF
jgi:hypothetical protein